MSFSFYVLILFYALLVFANFRAFSKGNNYAILTIVTMALATILLFSSNMAQLDWSESELDISGYRVLYEQYDVLEHQDFNLYYIFYGLMYFGQSYGLSFFTWWTIMSVLGMSVLALACKIHGLSINLFLASFMAYYEFVFYSGFKFFYGLCFFLLAYGFLLHDNRFSKLKYILFLCIAGGFHPLYYFFLIFLIEPKKNPTAFVSIIAILSVLFTIIIRISGSAFTFLAPFFNLFDNDHINKYTELNVHWGFYLPILLQSVIIYIAFMIRKNRKANGISNQATDTLFYTSILSLAFCPFYALALTFVRLQTAFSLVLITSNSVSVKNSAERVLCAYMSLLMVASFWFVQIISGWRGFIGNSLFPFFDVF